jgi:hypothetical protein
MTVYYNVGQTLLYFINNQTVQVTYNPPDCRILNCHYDKEIMTLYNNEILTHIMIKTQAVNQRLSSSTSALNT